MQVQTQKYDECGTGWWRCPEWGTAHSAVVCEQETTVEVQTIIVEILLLWHEGLHLRKNMHAKV